MPALIQRKVAVTSATSSATLTAVLDATPAPGNLLIAYVCHLTTSSATKTMPAGWTTTQSGDALGIFHKVAGASEPTSITVTFNSAQQANLVIEEWSGMIADAATVKDASAHARDSTNDNSHPTPSITTTTPDCLLVALIGARTLRIGEPTQVWANTWTNGFAQASTPWSGDGNVYSARCASTHATRIVSATGTYSTNETVTDGPPSTPTPAQPRAIIAAFKIDTSVVAPASAPGSVTASTVSDTQINLSWGTVATATGYQVEVNSGSPTSMSSPASITGLTPATLYSFRVRAVNSAGEGPWSSAVTATTDAPAPTYAHWIWTGHTTSTSMTASVYVDATTDKSVRLVVSTSPSLTSPVYGSSVTANAANGYTVKPSITGLTPGTRYYYGVEIGGEIDPNYGSFKTFPSGAGNLKIVVGACAEHSPTLGVGPSDHQVWARIRDHAPDMFIHCGDAHYYDVNTTVVADHRAPWDSLLGSVQQGATYRTMPMYHMWDDHDFTGDNRASNSVGRDAARTNWRAIQPGYPLNAPSSGNPIHYAFTAGRVRFIIPDTRSDRRFFAANVGDSTDTILGTVGRQWVLDELTAANADPDIALIVLQTGTPWIAADTSDDHWGGYPHERQIIADHIAAEGITNIVGIAGDMHAMAMDNGTNNAWGAFPILQSAPLWYKAQSFKGGPYSHGPYGVSNANGAQTTGSFALFQVIDNGGSGITVDWSLRRVNSSGVESVIDTLSFTVGGDPDYGSGWHRWNADTGIWEPLQ